MLRLIEVYNSVPSTFPISSKAEFQPGTIAQLCVENDKVVVGVSNGLAPIGIFDDIKTPSFSSSVYGETVLVKVPLYTATNGKTVSEFDTVHYLGNTNIEPSSFVSTLHCTLIADKGIAVFPRGTILNDGNEIKANVRYTYKMKNIIGDDSTKNTGKATIWVSRGIFATDQYVANVAYPVNATLFVNNHGLLTTENNASYGQTVGKNNGAAAGQAVGFVVSPPTASDSSLTFLWS